MKRPALSLGVVCLLGLSFANTAVAGTIAGGVFDLGQPPKPRANSNLQITVVGTKADGSTISLPASSVTAVGTYSLKVDDANIRAVSLTFHGAGFESTKVERVLNIPGQTVLINVAIPEAIPTPPPAKSCRIFGCLFSK